MCGPIVWGMAELKGRACWGGMQESQLICSKIGATAGERPPWHVPHSQDGQCYRWARWSLMLVREQAAPGLPNAFPTCKQSSCRIYEQCFPKSQHVSTTSMGNERADNISTHQNSCKCSPDAFLRLYWCAHGACTCAATYIHACLFISSRSR